MTSCIRVIILVLQLDGMVGNRVISRNAFRIKHGKFHLDGTEYSLATNSGNNHNHGGIKGYDKVHGRRRVWISVCGMHRFKKHRIAFPLYFQEFLPIWKKVILGNSTSRLRIHSHNAMNWIWFLKRKEMTNQPSSIWQIMRIGIFQVTASDLLTNMFYFFPDVNRRSCKWVLISIWTEKTWYEWAVNIK